MSRFYFLLLSILLFTLSQTHAQNVVFSAEASANTIGIEDQVQVSFTIENVQELQGIQNPSFSGFRVLGGPFQSQSTNYSISGNQQIRTSSISLSYVLQATQLGELKIPGIIAKDGQGKNYQSNAITIKVVKGSLAQKSRQQQQANDPFAGFDPFDDPFFGGSGSSDPMAALQQQQARMQQLLQQLQQQQGYGSNQNMPEVSEKDLGKNVFIKVSVDKTKVYLGEQITATYKMYARIPMQAQLSKLPSLNGFWTQDFELPKEQKPQTEILDGIQYQTFTLKKSALFPQQTGTLKLDAAEANGVARIADRANPYGKDVQFKLKSPEVSITVNALPMQNKPTNYGGAVGQFAIQSKASKSSLSTDETMDLIVDISGTGNLKLIEAPNINLPNGLGIFDPTIIDTITSRTTTISGHKIFTYSIAPKIAGDFEIPSITFSYYDSKLGQYKTIQTTPLKLHVTKGLSNKNNSLKEETISDLHDINMAPLASYVKSKSIFCSIWYWMAYLLALIGIIVFGFWKKNKESLENNSTLFKKRNANKIALKRLKTANNLLVQSKTIAFYEEISKALWLYLSDKLNIPLSLLSKETAQEALVKKNIPATYLESMNQIIDDCSYILYAPNSTSQQMNKTYNDTVELIGNLEEILK